MQGQSLLHRKAKIPFPAGLLRRRFSPCRPGSEAEAPGAVAPCIGKPKSPSPPGSCAVGSAHAARVQKQGCKGRSPVHKKTKNPPLPRWAPAPQVQPVPLPAQSRGCKGRSPLHEITLVSPFPAGEERSASAGRGDRGKNKAKGRGSRRSSRQAPLGTIAARSIRRPKKPAPRWARGALPCPVPSGFSPGDTRGEAPCMK